jgi:hypothetical protein
MSKKPTKGVRGGSAAQKGASVVRFFDWKRSDPTKYAGSNGLTEELLTYKKNLSALLPREGAFVLIKGQEVIGIYRDPEDALAAALDRFKDQRVLIKQIVSKEPIHSTGGVDC